MTIDGGVVLWGMVLLLLVGGGLVQRLAEPSHARRHALVLSGLTLLGCTALLGAHLLAGDASLDALSAPLAPLAALISFLAVLATQRTTSHRFSFAWALVTTALTLATIVSRDAWLVVAGLVLGVLPPYLEQREKGRSTRVFALHMSAFAAATVTGQALVSTAREGGAAWWVGIVLLTAGLLVRCGIAPFHVWQVDFYERGSFGTAILLTTPMVGVYGFMRLVLPIAPAPVLVVVSALALATTLYAACMAGVQRSMRGLFSFVLLGHSSLVLVGLDLAAPVSLTGALCVWLSVGLALTGFGLIMRCVEARMGRISLASEHGLVAHVPALAALFLVTGLASVGFPGTIGFVGTELLFEGALEASALVGALLVIAGALQGLAVVHAYFRIFTGRPHRSTIDLRCRPSERVAVLVLVILLVGGGLFPQPGVDSRHRAALGLLAQRRDHRSSPGPHPRGLPPSLPGPQDPPPAGR